MTWTLIHVLWVGGYQWFRTGILYSMKDSWMTLSQHTVTLNADMLCGIGLGWTSRESQNIGWYTDCARTWRVGHVWLWRMSAWGYHCPFWLWMYCPCWWLENEWGWIIPGCRNGTGWSPVVCCGSRASGADKAGAKELKSLWCSIRHAWHKPEACRNSLSESGTLQKSQTISTEGEMSKELVGWVGDGTVYRSTSVGDGRTFVRLAAEVALFPGQASGDVIMLCSSSMMTVSSLHSSHSMDSS